MILLDKLAYSSPIRKVSPGVKSLFAVGSLICCVAFRQPLPCALTLCCMAVCTLRFANVSFRQYLRFLSGPAVFLALSSLAVLFFISSNPQPIFSLAVGTRYIGISAQSLQNWIQLMATAFSGVSCLYFLILTTPLTDLLSLLRRLHCPSLLLELMLLIYRAIFVLLDIATAIQTAQNCRLGNRSFRAKLHGLGLMLSVLLVRSLKKSSLLYDAMESRLYDGQIRVLDQTAPAPLWLWASCGIWLAGLLLCSLAG